MFMKKEEGMDDARRTEPFETAIWFSGIILLRA